MLVFTDGADHYTTISEKWDYYTSSTAEASVSAAAKRSGSAGILCTWSSVGKNLPPQATYIVGCAVNLQTPRQSDGAFAQLVRFMDGSIVQVSVGVDAAGRCYIAPNGTAVVRSSAIVPSRQWRYLEVSATIGAAGHVIVRLDEQVILDWYGNTKFSANAYTNLIYLGTPNQFALTWFDDIYICDTTGTVNNTFLGDVKITALLPDEAGAYNAFTRFGTDSGANYSQCDETPPNTTDGVQSGNVGDRDSYGYPDIDGTILGVRLHGYASTDDGGTRSIALKARSGGVDASSTAQTLNQTWAYYSMTFEQNPATGLPWELAALNNAEFGFVIEA